MSFLPRPCSRRTELKAGNTVELECSSATPPCCAKFAKPWPAKETVGRPACRAHFHLEPRHASCNSDLMSMPPSMTLVSHFACFYLCMYTYSYGSISTCAPSAGTLPLRKPHPTPLGGVSVPWYHIACYLWCRPCGARPLSTYRVPRVAKSAGLCAFIVLDAGFAGAHKQPISPCGT